MGPVTVNDMLIKNTVKIDGLQPQMWVAFGFADAIFHELAGINAIMTSGLDSHDAGLHPKGLAIDLRLKTIKDTVIKDKIYKHIKDVLYPLGFDVLHEYLGTDREHIHIEYDPKPGRLSWLIRVE